MLVKKVHTRSLERERLRGGNRTITAGRQLPAQKREKKSEKPLKVAQG